MARPKESITERLNAANVAISNAISDPLIGKFLGEYGYQSQKLSEGKNLYEVADISVKKQITAYGGHESASARIM